MLTSCNLSEKEGNQRENRTDQRRYGFYQFHLKKAVVLLRKYMDPGTLSSYKNDLDIDEDSELDNISSISEEESGVDEKDNKFILSANEEISLDTIVRELDQTFMFEDCII